MKAYIIHIGDVLKCPPVLNLIRMFKDLKIDVHLICTESEYARTNIDHISIFVLPCNYERDRSLYAKFADMIRLRKIIWRYIDNNYCSDDLIWITSDTALKHVGEKIKDKRYILQFMELSENIRYQKSLPFKMDATLLGNKALAVVVPEYNRAHITKAWWNLDKLPLILENKPYIKTSIKKNSEIDDLTARDIINKIGNRKIILYQGIIHKERPLDQYIRAVDKLGDEYAFVIMSSGENIYSNIGSKNYFFIPYVKAPYHLQITSHAYIGVLSYFPTKAQYSILNALYCAPNKTFEYAMFGIPMLGNDVPGLKYTFSMARCGECADILSIENIIAAIKSIEADYESMSNSSIKYYNSVDTLKQLSIILSKTK